jgi:hypothetical protein
VYFRYTESLVQGQEARKDSIERRGMAVITTSGSLVTLLLGLVAVLTSADGFTLVTQARGPLFVALAAFAAAAVLALASNVPLPRYGNIDPDGLRKQLGKRPMESSEDGYVRLAASNLAIYERARRMNGVKAWLLVAAMVAEVSGAVSLAVAVGEVLQHS